MDLTRLKTLAGLSEGRMKDMLWDQAEMMDLEDFVANAGDHGMDEMEATEFWNTVHGMDEASAIDGVKQVTETPDNLESEFLNIIQDAIRNSEEEGAYGDVRDAHIEQAFSEFQKGDITGAAETILQSFSDADGGESHHVQNMYDDLVSDLEWLRGQLSEENVEEAVGQFAEPYFDLIDRVGGDNEATKLVNREALAWLGGNARDEITNGDDNYEDYMSHDDLVNEITRFMNGDEIKEFVAHFERHYDLNSEEEMEESVEEYTLEAVDVEEEELTEAPTMDTTQLVNMLRNAGMNEEAIAQKLEEWANTPEGVGEVEPTEHGDAYDFAQGVNLSLKRYLDAQDMKVSVNESHTAESLMEAYTAYKGEEIEEAEELDEAKVEEDDVKEGNAFSKALADAKKAGKDEFEVDGKKYKVNESEDLTEVGVNDIDDEECDNCGSPLHNGECPQCDAEEVEESADLARLRRLSGL